MTHKNDGKEEKGALRVDQTQLMFGEGFSFSGYERDPLYLNTGAKKFVDKAVRCGEKDVRPCAGGKATQNSYRHLVDVLGARD